MVRGAAVGNVVNAVAGEDEVTVMGGGEGGHADVIEGFESFLVEKTFRTCGGDVFVVIVAYVRVSISLRDVSTRRGRRVRNDLETVACCVEHRVAPEDRCRTVARVTAC